jgi:hypothetical protein
LSGAGVAGSVAAATSEPKKASTRPPWLPLKNGHRRWSRAQRVREARGVGGEGGGFKADNVEV